MHQTEKDPRQGSPLSDVRVDLWRNTGQRGLLVASYKRLEKDSDGAITPAAVAVHVAAHLVPPGSPQAKQLCHLHAQLSLGQSCHRQKTPCVYAHRVAWVMSSSVTLWTVTCQASLSGRGVLQARILEGIGHYWLPCPPRALYSLLP